MIDIDIDGDDRWAAAYEMGRLDGQLAARLHHDRKLGLSIAAANRQHADALARRHGYELHVDEVGDPGRLWAELWPSSVAYSGTEIA